MASVSETTEVDLAATHSDANAAATNTAAANNAVGSLAEIVEAHQADVWRYLRYLGAESADADDLTQETFLALSRSTFEERGHKQTAAYLRTVARNQLLMLRRFQGREIDTVELEAAEEVWAGAVERTGGMTGLLAMLADCLDAVDGRAREAVHLFYREGLSRTAIASALEMKPDGVKTLLRRTRDVLRDCIERKSTREEKQ